MGDPQGFIKTKRLSCAYRSVEERVKDHQPVWTLRAEEISRKQASRCMDCGTPFCHSACPIGNIIPEWNDLVFRGHWEKALDLLRATNNLPEVTGRVCPALCEYACVLGINDDPVTIRENELGIVEYGFQHGLIKARKPGKRTGKKIAVVGSGPAGLSCADQLNQAGHAVTVFERDPRCGGILRYGIPDFKLEKNILDRRLAVWQQEGIVFRPGVHVGVDPGGRQLLEDFDAVILCGGSRVPRDLPLPGRQLDGVHFAMEYLTQNNRRIAGERIDPEYEITAAGRNVLVIGGGDTGADCVGTAHRQGACSVTQIEVLPQPPSCRTPAMPWPKYPMLLKTSTSHEEGGRRQWAVLVKMFNGVDARVSSVQCCRLDYSQRDARGCPMMKEVPGSEFSIPAELVLICIGFLHPEHTGLLKELNVALDPRGNVQTDEQYQTSTEKVFAAGDMRRGQSLVVWAVSEGRRCARAVDSYLMGSSALPAV